MSAFWELDLPGLFRRFRPELLIVLLSAGLASCGGGGGGGSDTPPPPPPPPPGGNVPPLSTTVTDITNGQQIGATHWSFGDTSTGGQGQTVAGLECMSTVPEGYHVHTHLSILLNGEALAVPAGIGFVQSPDCTYQLHTHSPSGLLHVHATAPGTFTLGQIFQIWGHPLTSSDVAGLSGMPVQVFVTDNGVTTENTGDWSAIELTSHRLITIQVGTDITEIPNFTWSGP